MYCDRGKVYIEEDDQCIDCENFTKHVDCPLIQALALGYVYMDDILNVTNCNFYKHHERHLKLVKDLKKED